MLGILQDGINSHLTLRRRRAFNTNLTGAFRHPFTHLGTSLLGNGRILIIGNTKRHVILLLLVITSSKELRASLVNAGLSKAPPDKAHAWPIWISLGVQ